jgi:hypothetical protein
VQDQNCLLARGWVTWTGRDRVRIWTEQTHKSLAKPPSTPRDTPANIRYMALISTRTENTMAGQDHTTDHKHGSMSVKEQEKTFAGFIRFLMWGIGLSIGILIFLALVNA